MNDLSSTPVPASGLSASLRCGEALNFGALHALDWFAAVVAGFVSFTWFEVYKHHARG